MSRQPETRLRLPHEAPFESDGEALKRYNEMSFKDVHPGHWTALLTIANDWYEAAQELHAARTTGSTFPHD